MKKIRFIPNIIMGLGAMLLLTACTADSDSEPEERLSTSPSYVKIVAGNDMSAYFTVSSNTSWSINKDYSDSWLSCSPMEGKGEQEVHVYATDKNKGKDIRTATLTIQTLSGKKTVTIEVSQEITPLTRYWIYGENPSKEPPFQPGTWDATAMRFSDTEGAHLPTIPDNVYFGLKTLIFNVSDASENLDLKVMNGWWSNTYYDHVKWVNGLNELQITNTMAKECAQGGEGKDLDLMLYSGTMTLKSVYYEDY
jgi:hypothetical protein